MTAAVENLRKDIRMRGESDPMMSYAWLLLYLIPIFGIIIAGFSILASVMVYPAWGTVTAPLFLATLLVLAGLLVLVGFIVSLILRYKLIQRRNTHFKRQSFLFEDIVGVIKSTAAKKGIDVEVGVSSCERTVREAKAEETEKSAVLWAILSAFIFLAEWYINYFLMKDFYKHERREDGFWEDLNRTLDKLGITFSPERRVEATPDRSFVLYLILSIITLGLFQIYWLYILLRDPNEHFKHHRKLEDQLISALESVAV